VVPPDVMRAMMFDSDTQLAEAQRLGRVGSWTWDIARRAFDGSPELFRILGVPPEEPIDPAALEHLLHLVHGDDRASLRTHLDKQISARAPYSSCEFRVTHRDDRTHWVILRAELRYDSEGRPASARGTLQEVTERHELEEQLRRAQHMEALGQLAAGIAHDFNNFLTIIQVEADLLQAGLADSDSLHAEVGEIRKAAQRAASLTRQLLAFSRKQVLRLRVLDLNELIGETATMLRRLIGEDIELVTELASDLPLLLGDPGRLQQVLLNLAVNSRDAMPAGGTLRISTGSATIDERDPLLPAGTYCVLTVADTGHGIDPGVQQRMFDPFFTTKPPGKGTGLGLSTVVGIVEQTGGWVFVSSESNCGATFTIYLPCGDQATLIDSPPDGAACANHAHARQAHAHATVLLVEDERPLRSAAQRVLEAAGYTVIAAEDGFQGIAAAETFAGTIDLLVTDIVLPGISGPEIAGRLQQRRPRMQVLYVSGYPDEDVARRGLLDPDMPLLEKPFSAKALVDTVRDLVQDHRFANAPREPWHGKYDRSW
jgi:two-component system cell cycle sensor histidine kinase/response regulator CckA